MTAVHEIRIYGDPVLRKTARAVETFDEQLGRFIDKMTETMLVKDGVGLAANQVGETLRIAVIDTTAGEKPPIVFVNPIITAASDETAEADEGCLSLPGITLQVKRHLQMSVSAHDRGGNPFTIEQASGLLARALQHEIDHLDGVLIIDRVSALQRAMIRGKLKKLAKTGSVDG
ncbi:MAG: peptide deformylase [Chitinispirillaceae bacterium]|nr:peptide deformylase [Chitinispirillaceae bacterium]